MELKKEIKSRLYTLIDANANRAKEGLRVCEDIARFMDRNGTVSKSLKKIRHMISLGVKKTCPTYSELLVNRDSASDVGRKIKIAGEFSRDSVASLLTANFKRSQESLRVLEETSKLIDKTASAAFKEEIGRASCWERVC